MSRQPPKEASAKTILNRKRFAKPTSHLPSLAKQSFKKECDINLIMKKFEKTGMVDHLNKHHGNYGNFIGANDYHTSLNQLLSADEAFATVPSKIRQKFDNDPALFLAFVQDPENIEEMIELGLANRGAPDVASPSTVIPGTPGPDDPSTASTTP